MHFVAVLSLQGQALEKVINTFSKSAEGKGEFKRMVLSMIEKNKIVKTQTLDN